MQEEKKIKYEQNNLETDVVNETFDKNLETENTLHKIETARTISIDSIAESESDNNHDESLQTNEIPLSPQLLFGNIAVQNASDITFGNKSYYQGPITIKQCLHNGNIIPKSSKSERFRKFIIKRKRCLSLYVFLFSISLILLALLLYWRKIVYGPDFSHPGTLNVNM